MNYRTLYGRLLVVLFFAIFLAQTFSRFFIIADYYAHVAEYAQNCVNQAIPKMHCNGKCQMMKRLQQEQKDDQDNQERLANGKNEVVYFSPFAFIGFRTPVSDLPAIKAGLLRAEGPALMLCVDIFHPPRA